MNKKAKDLHKIYARLYKLVYNEIRTHDLTLGETMGFFAEGVRVFLGSRPSIFRCRSDISTVKREVCKLMKIGIDQGIKDGIELTKKQEENKDE